MNINFELQRKGAVVPFDPLNDRLVIRGASAAEMEVVDSAAGVRLIAPDGHFVTLQNTPIEALSVTNIRFDDGSQLLIGDNNAGLANDAGANMLAPTFDPRDDQLIGLGGDDVLDGRDGNDRIFGRGGDDQITGGDGDDWLAGGLHDDTIMGGAGRDTVVVTDLPGETVASGNDTVNGGADNDTINYFSAKQGTQPILNGDSGNDTITGGNGDDTIDGGDDNDRVYAGSGQDSITGGTGRDVMTGGRKDQGGDDFQDIFVFQAIDSRATGAHDVVMDFETGMDKFDLPIAAVDRVNYFEERVRSDDFGEAFAKAEMVMRQNEGFATYVYIDGASDGWLFADFANADMKPDFAVRIENGVSLASFGAGDIV